MAGVRKALIVATDEYGDPRLTRLNAPANDARALADVLRDEAVGCFEVETALNRSSHEVALAIAEFFGAGKFGDTLLAHFSCHGVKSPSGELYFATTDTNLSDPFKLKVTGVPSALVRDAMEDSRASLILCLVDCCYSGAFVKLAKAADTVDLTERLGGKGRAVITASTSLQLALDGEEEPSLFTHAVIDGLRSGEADRDLDGLVSLDELYSYVYEQVTSRNPHQTPVKSFDVQGDVFVARRSTPVTRAAPLDPDLLADARALLSYKRLGAVNGLAAVLDEKHPGRSLAARLELTRMAGHDDSLAVRGEAQKVLDGAGELPTPTIPAYEPTVATRGGPAVGAAPDTDHASSIAATDSWSTDTGSTDTGSTDTGSTDTGSTDTDDGGWDDRGWLDWLRSKRAGLIGLGLIAVLVITGIVWKTNRNRPPVLPVQEMLIAINSQGISEVDSATGSNLGQLINNRQANSPTISEDRRWMVYLMGQAAQPGVPHRARVDGSHDSLLLDKDASNQCPSTTRAAFSPDGAHLAVICYDAHGSVMLGIVDSDGNLVPLLRDNLLKGAPTWVGDHLIVFMRKDKADKTTTLHGISPDTGEEQKNPITKGTYGSDSFPDWSNQGLLFLRTPEHGSSYVVYKKSLDARGVTIPSSTGAKFPTWAPQNQPMAAWLEPATPDTNTLVTKTVSEDPRVHNEPPKPLGTGAYGAPAWGSR